MKTIKQAIIILLAVLIVANVASYFYFGTSDAEVPPKISCPAEPLEILVKDGHNIDVLLKDVVASDAQDGDLTDRVIYGGTSKLISKDTAKVTYFVFDSDNNVASCVRYIRYIDYERPTFEVVEPLVFSTTEEVTLLARLKAIDVLEGDISKNIRVSTLEPTNNSELYNVTIQVSNSLGDTSRVTLPVLMLANNPSRPQIQLTDYLLYLQKGEKLNITKYIKDLKVPGVQDASIADIEIDYSTLDTGKAGIYYVTYSYTADGSTGTAILTVVVQ